MGQAVPALFLVPCERLYCGNLAAITSIFWISGGLREQGSRYLATEMRLAARVIGEGVEDPEGAGAYAGGVGSQPSEMSPATSSGSTVISSASGSSPVGVAVVGVSV